jgi:hypothetical protein
VLDKRKNSLNTTIDKDNGESVAQSQKEGIFVFHSIFFAMVF